MRLRRNLAVWVLASVASVASACTSADRASSGSENLQPRSDTLVLGRVFGTDERPLGGARIRAVLLAPQSRLPTPQHHEITSSSAGDYRLRLLPAEYLMQVTHGRYSSRHEVVKLGKADQLQRDWRLIPSGSVSGSVLGPHAAGSGAQVTLMMLDTHDPEAFSPQTTVASTDGRFRFENVPAGVASLTVRGAGLLSPIPAFVNVAPGREVSDVALSATAAHVEEPVAVRVEAPDVQDQKILGAPTFRVAGSIRPKLEALITLSRPAITPDLPPLTLATEYLAKGKGTFAIERVPEGEVILTAVSRDGSSARRVLEVGPSDPGDVVVELVQARRIAGRVADAEGNPVPGVTVVAAAQSDSIDLSEPTNWLVNRDASGPDGSFSISNVSARSVTLRVLDSFGALLSPLSEGGANPQVQVVTDTLTSSGAAVESNLTVSRCGEVVRGRVQDSVGRPVSFASVRLTVARNQRADAHFKALSLASLTHQDGSFEFAGLCQRRYELVAVDPARTASSSPLYTSAGKTDLEITLLPRRRLELSITQQKEPVTEFAVELSGRVDYRFPVRSKDGSFLSPPLDPGSVRFVAVAIEGYVDSYLRVPTETQSLVAHHELRPWSTLQGRVVDAAQRPVAAAWVAVSIRPPGLAASIPELALAHLSARVQTDRAGRFRLPRLMHGELLVRIAKGGRFLAMRRARVETSAEPLVGPGTVTKESLRVGQSLDLGDLELYHDPGNH